MEENTEFHNRIKTETVSENDEFCPGLFHINEEPIDEMHVTVDDLFNKSKHAQKVAPVNAKEEPVDQYSDINDINENVQDYVLFDTIIIKSDNSDEEKYLIFKTSDENVTSYVGDKSSTNLTVSAISVHGSFANHLPVTECVSVKSATTLPVTECDRRKSLANNLVPDSDQCEPSASLHIIEGVNSSVNLVEVINVSSERTLCNHLLTDNVLRTPSANLLVDQDVSSKLSVLKMDSLEDQKLLTDLGCRIIQEIVEAEDEADYAASVVDNNNSMLDLQSPQDTDFSADLDNNAQSAMELQVVGNVEVNSAVMYSCECGKSFSTASNLKRHKNKHTSDLKKCLLCDKGYCTDYELKQHLISHGQGLQCETCGKTFRSKAGLNSHAKEHNGIFKFLCQTCGKGFNSKDTYENHLAMHEQIKPYKCTSCKKKFANKSNLNRHAQNCGIFENSTSLNCDLCGKVFKQKRYLKDHIKGHKDPERFICVTCGNYFKYKSSLHKHIKSHGHQ